MDTIQCLETFIHNNGPKSLEENPWEAYQALLKDGCTPALARLLLYSFVSGIPHLAEKTTGEDLTKQIQNTCGLMKKKALELSAIYESIYSTESQAARKEQTLAGFRALVQEDALDLTWEGNTAWHSGGGSVDCTCHGEFTVHVENEELLKKSFGEDLEKNPYLDEEALIDMLEEELDGTLDNDFEEYCTCDDYYEPYVEEYGVESGEDTLRKFCETHGLALDEYHFDGMTGDFEPDHYGYY